MTKHTIEDVCCFWDSNPLLSGEIHENLGTKAWFEKFDEIKLNDVFCADLSLWVPQGLEGKRVLDVGCGPGFWHRIFGKMKVEYYGIDISPKTIELAKKSQALFGLQGNLAVGNAEHLDFPDGYFDYVLSEGVIHHTPDTQQCIQEMYRVLASGGSAAIAVYYRGFILRSPFLFKYCVLLMRWLRVGLKGRGREQMTIASHPDDFVRMYDGVDNPIGKAYGKKELKKMFAQFSRVRFYRYYLPSRAFPITILRMVQRMLSSIFGLMILVRVEK